MKILLIFILHLISGGAAGIDVIGFPGGRVTISCNYDDYGRAKTHICKMKTQTECEYITVIKYEQCNTWIQKDRFDIINDCSRALTVTIRQLSSEDAGTYQCGEVGRWSHQFNLQVIRDPCCLGPRTVFGHLGETFTISCSYPEQFERHSKYFYKLDGHRIPTMIDTTETQRGRFSISDDRSSKVVSVRISDVREDDGGVYYCAVLSGGDSVSYYSLYTETQLQVTEKSTTGTPDSTNTIIVCVCVALLLLLIGGLISPAVCDYEEIKDRKPQSDSKSTPRYAAVQPPTISSDPLNSVYATARHPTVPSDPPNPVYATAQLPTIPSDPLNSVYATAQHPTVPSDPPNLVYATAQLPTIPSDPLNSVYATAQHPTVPSDPPNLVYATVELPTMPSDPPNPVYATVQ
ncbi:CMRF35-like molecule 8 [Colossoma macropomum]|uniref:CMRF35-like molecule 8 n=1 Tax=Colossoma macropomum TaxID=42526 RepID=UPI001864DFE7|nr:CMRF35-like molecule 8 [Colossoma macropomum]